MIRSSHIAVPKGNLLLFAAVCCLLFACNPAGKLAKQADVYAAKGQTEDAATYYYNALLKNKNHRRAHDGLQQTGQVVLNEKFNTFSKLVVENNIEGAMKQYGYAQKYSANAASVGVILRWPDEYDEVYNDIRQEYIGTLYDEALVMMNNKKYDLAEKQFEKIASLDSNFKDVSVLRMNSVMEPLYQQGMRNLSAGKYKEAYKFFLKVIALDENYKDVKERRDEALSKATLKVGILQVVNRSGMKGEEAGLNEELKKTFAGGSASFVKIIGADEMKEVLGKRGWSDISTEERAAEAGKSVEIQYVLLTKLETAVDSVEKQEKVQRTAYEAFTENILNPYTGTYSYLSKFKKVTYEDSYEARHVKYTVSYALISSKDGKVITGDKIEVQKSDELHRFIFSGNPNNLYKDPPKENSLPPIDQDWRAGFNPTRTRLLEKEVLARELNRDIAKKINLAISKYLK